MAMHPVRKQRLGIVVFILLASAAAAAFLGFALRENINLFYPPADIAAGKAPLDRKIRAGGMVEEGSVQRASDSLKSSYSDGAKAGFAASGGTSTMGTVGRDSSPAPSTPSTPDGPPAWAQQMRRGRAMSHGVTAAAHAVRSGDSHGGGAGPDIKEKD